MSSLKMQLVSKSHAGLSYQVLAPGRELPEGGNADHPDLPTVFILHGYGANGQDLVPVITYGGFADKVQARWIFVQAPLVVPISPYDQGWAWFELNMEELFGWAQTQDLAALAGWQPPDIDTVTRRLSSLVGHEGAKSRKVVLGGFSQGAIVSLHAALSGLKVEALVLLSCTWIHEAHWKDCLTKVKLPPVFQSHGRQDPILPFGAALKLNEELKKASIPVEFHPFGGGHEIPLHVLNSLQNFLASAVR